jgi:hypothetical protein
MVCLTMAFTNRNQQIEVIVKLPKSRRNPLLLKRNQGRGKEGENEYKKKRPRNWMIYFRKFLKLGSQMNTSQLQSFHFSLIKGWTEKSSFQW